MAYNDNERLQEFFIVVGDMLAPVRKIWWYTLLFTIVFAIPAYYVVKNLFVVSFTAGYSGPDIVYVAAVKEPLQVTDRKIFKHGNNVYSGYVRIKNPNLAWGVEAQEYSIQLKTHGGTVVNSFNRSVFILPASEKLIVLPRFNYSQEPDVLEIELTEPIKFIHRPDVDVSFDTQREVLTNASDGLKVSGAFVNTSPFTIKQVNLPVLVYNNRNEIVAVNFTSINDVKSSETRTFQMTWPEPVEGAVRAQISPEINIFDRNILSTDPGVSPFDTQDSSDRPSL